MPLYVLGLMGVTRRLRVFDDPSLQIWFVIAAHRRGPDPARHPRLPDPDRRQHPATASSCATSPAIPGTAARSNGRPPRRRRTTTSPSRRSSTTRRLVGHEEARLSAPARRASGRSTCRSNTGTGVILAGFATALGFALIWYIWWLAALSFVALLAVGDRSHLQLSTATSTSRPTRSSRTEDARTKLLAGARVDDCRLSIPRRTGEPGLLPRRTSTTHPEGCSTMLGFWIYLMSDCLIFAMPVRHLRRARRQLRRRPGAEGSVRAAAGRGQHLDAAALLDHLWLRHAGDAAGQVAPDADLAGVTGLFGARLHRHRALRVRPHDP